MHIADLLLSLGLIWLAAKLAGEGMERLGQTAVLGELLVGVVIGPHALRLVNESQILHALAEMGVILLLFEIGLESDRRSWSASGLSPPWWHWWGSSAPSGSKGVLATALLTVVAVIGKLASGLAVYQKAVRAWPVAVGMVPRGEVGLIFAWHRAFDRGARLKPLRGRCGHGDAVHVHRAPMAQGALPDSGRPVTRPEAVWLAPAAPARPP